MGVAFVFLIGYAVGAFTAFFIFSLNTPDDDECMEDR